MTDREQLAARIEAAGVDEQRAMLVDAFAYIHKMDDGLAPADWSALNWPFADRFTAMLDAEAYESAAMMMVPEDMRINSWAEYGQGMGRLTGRFTATLVPKVPPPIMASFHERTALMAICKDAATPALALSAAAIRAGGA